MIWLSEYKPTMLAIKQFLIRAKLERLKNIIGLDS